DPKIIRSRERLLTWVIEEEGGVRVRMKHMRSYLNLNSCKEAKELLRPGHGHVYKLATEVGGLWSEL
ncbi:hypothetical protein Tco_0897856, partial [Tanacetum coccineum]